VSQRTSDKKNSECNLNSEDDDESLSDVILQRLKNIWYNVIELLSMNELHVLSMKELHVYFFTI